MSVDDTLAQMIGRLAMGAAVAYTQPDPRPELRVTLDEFLNMPRHPLPRTVALVREQLREEQ